jgi:CHAT domain-containing protein
MDLLEDYVGRLRYRERPIEMLVLSACDTAAGDDRSALGLSGIAIKAGARSAVGSLWQVNDAASAVLVKEFYAQLADPKVSRAEALRRAQERLRQDLRYWHPGYWSAFQLISNWL